MECELSDRCACGNALPGAGNAGLKFSREAISCSEESEGDTAEGGNDYKRRRASEEHHCDASQ